MKHLNSMFFILALIMFGGAFTAIVIDNNDLWILFFVFGWSFNILGFTIH